MRVIREDTRESFERDYSVSDRWSLYAFLDRFEMYWIWATYGYWVMSVWTFGELHWVATEKGMVSIDSRLGLVSFQGSLLIPILVWVRLSILFYHIFIQFCQFKLILIPYILEL